MSHCCEFTWAWASRSTMSRKIRYWRQKPWMRDYMQGLYEHRASIPRATP
jgi:hypothetical protein